MAESTVQEHENATDRSSERRAIQDKKVSILSLIDQLNAAYVAHYSATTLAADITLIEEHNTQAKSDIQTKLNNMTVLA